MSDIEVIKRGKRVSKVMTSIWSLYGPYKHLSLGRSIVESESSPHD